MHGSTGNYTMQGDSSLSNIGFVTPGKYAGADIQIKIPNGKKGFSEFRAEYIRGLQTGTGATSETPGSYPYIAGTAPMPLFTRSFDGAYLYFL
jgi:hypothetical protein